MNPVNGTILGGRYALTGRIAAGGMGEVWAAADPVLGRTVAVKLLSPALGEQSGFLERFRAEARNCAALHHPNITTVFDYGEDGGSAYLVMELVTGQPLSQVIADRAPLSAQTTASVLGQAARALEAAHQSGVVHRDVKPANILITPDGTAKLTDFGISRLVDAAPLTRTGEVLGTAQYLSPEQALGQGATASSDLYSLGVVGFEMLTGQLPFDAGTAVGTALAHINQPPPLLPDTVPAGIRGVIQAALAKDPADRPASAATMARTLGMPEEAFASGAPPAASPPATTLPATTLPATTLPAAVLPAVALPAPAVLALADPARTQAMPSLTRQAQTRAMPALDTATGLPDRQHRLRPTWLLGAAAALALIGAAAFALPGGDDTKAPVATPTTSSTPSQNATDRFTSPSESTGTTAQVAAPPTDPSKPATHTRARDKARGHNINKDGKPVAALVDAELFARIRRMRERFDALSSRVTEAYGEVPVEEGLAEIDAAVAAERKRR